MDKKKETPKKSVKKTDVKEDKVEKVEKADKVEKNEKVNASSKKDMIIVTVAVSLVILLTIAACVFLFVKNSHKNLNLQELNTTISEMAPYKDMTMLDIDSYILNSLYEVPEEQYEEAVGKMPMLNVQSSMYLVIKAKEDTVDEVKEKVESYAQKQEDAWSKYLPEQYELVKNRKQGVVGNYIYLIIGENAEEVEKLVK